MRGVKGQGSGDGLTSVVEGRAAAQAHGKTVEPQAGFARCGAKGTSSMAKIVSNSDGMPEMLTADEVAEFLRTSRKAIYSMVARGQLPEPCRIGRRLLFERLELLSWAQKSRAASFGRNV